MGETWTPISGLEKQGEIRGGLTDFDPVDEAVPGAFEQGEEVMIRGATITSAILAFYDDQELARSKGRIALT